jgi:hypothetical protein
MRIPLRVAAAVTAAALTLSSCSGSASAADEDACAVLGAVVADISDGVGSGDPVQVAEMIGDLSEQLEEGSRVAEDEALRSAMFSASVQLSMSLLQGLAGASGEEALAPFFEAMDEAAQRCADLGVAD